VFDNAVTLFGILKYNVGLYFHWNAIYVPLAPLAPHTGSPIGHHAAWSKLVNEALAYNFTDELSIDPKYNGVDADGPAATGWIYTYAEPEDC